MPTQHSLLMYRSLTVPRPRAYSFSLALCDQQQEDAEWALPLATRIARMTRGSTKALRTRAKHLSGSALHVFAFKDAVMYARRVCSVTDFSRFPAQP